MDVRRLILRSLMLLIGMLGVSSQVIESATYWVHPSASAGSGCQDSPTPLTTTAKRTIEAGISCLSAGDTLRVRAGTYSETVFMITGPSGTSWSNPVTIEANPGEQVIWAVPSGQVQAIRLENVQYVIFSGFIFDGTTGSNSLTSQYTSLAVSGSDNLFIMGCNDGSTTLCARNIRLQNSELRNTAYGVAQPCQHCGRLEFLNNYVHDIGKVENCALLYWLAPNGLIEGNTFERSPCGAVNFWNQFNDTTHDGIVRNNSFRDIGLFWSNNNGNRECCHPINNNCSGGIDCGARIAQGVLNNRAVPIQVARGNNGQVYNNVISNSVRGIYIGFGVSNALVANNTIFGNTATAGGFGVESAGIYFDPQCSNSTAQNNIVYQPGVSNPPPLANLGTNNSFSTNMCSSGTNCTVNNPGFVNPAGGTPQGFKLAAGSPAIGQGVNLSSTFTTDFEGTPRAAGSAPWDLGSFTTLSTPQPDPLTLLAYWPLNEGTDTTAADASGNGHTGTLDSAAWSSPGIIGASSFAPTGTQEITVADLTGLSNTNSCSLNVWINMTTVDVNGCAIISNREGCSIYLSPTGLPQCWLSDGTNFPLAEGSASVLTGTNHMLSCTYDRLEASPALRLSVDALQTTVTTFSNPIFYGIASGAFRIGRDGAAFGGYQCHGRIDEPRIYSGALTATGIQNLYNQMVPTPGVSVVHTQWTAANAPEGSFTGPLDSDRNLTFGPSATIGLRSALHNATGGPLTEYFRTFCRINTGTWGAWTEVTNNFGSLGIRYLNPDTAVNLGDLTTRLLPLDGFVGTNGKFIADAVDLTSPYDAAQKITVGHGEQAEHEVRLELSAPLVATNLVQCKLRRESGADLDDYGGAGDPLVKTLTLVPPAPPSLQLVGGHVQGGRRQ